MSVELMKVESARGAESNGERVPKDGKSAGLGEVLNEGLKIK